MRKLLIATILMAILLSGCMTTKNLEVETDAGAELTANVSDNSQIHKIINVTDSAGNTVTLANPPKKVFSLSSSFAEIWQLAGGELSGVTSDALEGRDMGLSEDILVLGTVKEPNMELILSEEPDFMILSQDLSFQVALTETLTNVGIPHYMARVDTLDDYLKALNDFAVITGDKDKLYENGELVKAEVLELLSRLPNVAEGEQKTALFLRAFSSDVKVKASEHTVCYILDDIGVENVAKREGFPLEELSIEAIVEIDPDYIFIVAMGDEEAAKAYVEEALLSSPAWNSLSAVKNGNMIMLEKGLYHYKPNNRWGEAYETILQIIYPEVYGKQ